MKTYIKILFFSVFISFFSLSCSDDDKDQLPFKVSTSEINSNATASSHTIHIVSTGSWNVKSSVDWCKVNPTSGDYRGTIKIEIEIDENTTNESRTGILYITSANETAQIVINQASKDLLLLKKEKYIVGAQGDNIVVEFQTNGNCSVDIKDDWIKESVSKSISDVTKTFTIAANFASTSRSGQIKLTLGSITETITIEQEANMLFIAADKSLMENDALALAKKMQIGWNLGNSLESCNENAAGETLWGNARTTQKLIDAVKSAGFSTIRIPCAWSGYIIDQKTYKIDPSWMARVKEVVDYCVNRDMYAIINIHWDGGWRDENPFYDKQESILKKQNALWEQIAVYFRDYDEHLLFAGTNEVHSQTKNSPSAENLEVQLSFNQSFVNTVRATGGRNTWRNLIIQGYNTNIDLSVKYLKMPNDVTPNRIMTEVHFYDPWNFCGDENSNVFLWGKDFTGNANAPKSGLEDWIDKEFSLMKSNFVDKGIPVVLGEYGAILRSDLPTIPYQNHIKSRNYFLNYLTNSAIKNGLVPIYWDNGYTGNFGFGLFDRTDGSQAYPDVIKSIISTR